MSSRHQKEKRLRPRHDPYKRDQFDQSKYLRIPHSKQDESIVNEDLEDYNEEQDYDDFVN